MCKFSITLYRNYEYRGSHENPVELHHNLVFFQSNGNLCFLTSVVCSVVILIGASHPNIYSSLGKIARPKAKFISPCHLQ